MITFEKPGKENTDKTIELAIAYAKEHAPTRPQLPAQWRKINIGYPPCMLLS